MDKKNETFVTGKRLLISLKECVETISILGEHSVSAVAMTEWGDGSHTHLGFEIMDVNGDWIPIFVLPMAVCRAEAVRNKLHQFPLFRLAWYGHSGDPSNTPHDNMPEHDR